MQTLLSTALSAQIKEVLRDRGLLCSKSSGPLKMMRMVMIMAGVQS